MFSPPKSPKIQTKAELFSTPKFNNEQREGDVDDEVDECSPNIFSERKRQALTSIPSFQVNNRTQDTKSDPT